MFALACSTYENLTALRFIERLHRQSERLAREIVSPEPPTADDADIDGSYAASVHGGGGEVEGGEVEHQEKDRPRTPYWQGQQSRPTHVPCNPPNEDEYDEIEDSKYNRSRGKGCRDKRNNRQHRRVNSANSVRQIYNDNEEVGFVFKVKRFEKELTSRVRKD